MKQFSLLDLILACLLAGSILGQISAHYLHEMEIKNVQEACNEWGNKCIQLEYTWNANRCKKLLEEIHKYDPEYKEIKELHPTVQSEGKPSYYRD